MRNTNVHNVIFLTQNESAFNEHVSSAHVGKPTCPFCYVGFPDFPALRKHCEISHQESGIRRKETSRPEGWKRPCRFFRNGKGKCTPRSGTCNFDHTIIPEKEREL